MSEQGSLVSRKLGAGRLVAATVGVIRKQGRTMLAAAPWSLAVFVLTLPFALIVSSLYRLQDWMILAAALVCLIAFARTTYAWHRVVLLGETARTAAARGGSPEARHFVLLGGLAVGGMAIARATGDLPYVLYMLIGGGNDELFYGMLMALLALVWLPVLYGLAVYGLSLPCAAVTGTYGFGAMRGAMRYPRWPLMLAFLTLLVLGAHASNDLRPMLYDYVGVQALQGVLAAVGCVGVIFVLTAMTAVAYRDSEIGAELN